jgi:hypothetical protein
VITQCQGHWDKTHGINQTPPGEQREFRFRAMPINKQAIEIPKSKP